MRKGLFPASIWGLGFRVVLFDGQAQSWGFRVYLDPKSM